MNANPILLQKKYVRIVELFAEKMGISVETALGIFYHSQLYQLISEGISDMHCMSDGYLAEELEIEYNKKQPWNMEYVTWGKIHAGRTIRNGLWH